jgi:hypothetical protein
LSQAILFPQLEKNHELCWRKVQLFEPLLKPRCEQACHVIGQKSGRVRFCKFHVRKYAIA